MLEKDKKYVLSRLETIDVEKEKAVEYAEKAVELDPTNERLKSNLELCRKEIA